MSPDRTAYWHARYWANPGNEHARKRECRRRLAAGLRLVWPNPGNPRLTAALAHLDQHEVAAYCTGLLSAMYRLELDTLSDEEFWALCRHRFAQPRTLAA